MGLVLLVVIGIIVIIVLNILKAQGVSLPGVGRLQPCGAWGLWELGCLAPTRSGCARHFIPIACHCSMLTSCHCAMPDFAAEPAAAAVGATRGVVKCQRQLPSSPPI